MSEVKRDTHLSQGGSQLQLQLLRHLPISPPTSNFQHTYTHPLHHVLLRPWETRLRCAYTIISSIDSILILVSHHPHHQRHRSPLRRPLPCPEYVPLPCPVENQTNRSNHGYYTVGWGRSQPDAFGATQDSTSIKAKSVDLIASVRTVMRSMSLFPPLLL